MGAERNWKLLRRGDAEALAERWWDTQEERIHWLEEALRAEGLTLRRDAETLREVFAWLVRIAETPRQGTDLEPPAWWVPDGEGLWDLPFGPATAVASDALALALERDVRSMEPDVIRVLGPLTRSKYWTEGENAPGLIVVGGSSHFLVLCGPEEAARLASWASKQAASPEPDLLTIRVASIQKRIETSRRKAVEASSGAVAPTVPPVQVERSQEDPDFRWEVGVDAMTASEEEGRVRDYVEALGKLPGVTEAYHQDREQILVAGRITKRALLEHAETWWSHTSQT